MIKNDHISRGSLARRCQARLTRTRPFLPAAAAARDKLRASTPEVGGGGGGQRGPGRTHLNSAGRRGPGSPGKLPERRRESKLHDPEPHNRSDRDPAPLRAAPGGFSDAPQRRFCLGKRTGNRLQCLAQRVRSTLRHHCFNTKSRTLIRRELII